MEESFVTQTGRSPHRADADSREGDTALGHGRGGRGRGGGRGVWVGYASLRFEVSIGAGRISIFGSLTNLRVPSSSPSVSRRFGDLHGPGIALPCAQRVAQQFLNFLPLPQGQ